MTNTDYIEAIGVLTGVISVWLTIKKNVYCWLWGIISVLAYMVIFFEVKLYADMVLQGVFIGMNIFGWYEWLKSSNKPHLPEEYQKVEEEYNFSTANREIKNLPLSSIPVLSAFTLGFALVCGYALRSKTDASLPEIDALLTSLSLVAIWMQAKKYLENWYVWILADTLYVGMFVAKKLWLTAALYLVFTVLACKGWLEWRKFLSPPSQVISTS